MQYIRNHFDFFSALGGATILALLIWLLLATLNPVR
jgi:hypothetical protein